MFGIPVNKGILYIVIFSLSLALLVRNKKYTRFVQRNGLAFPEEKPCTADQPIANFEGCSPFRIINAVRNAMPTDCPWDHNYEIRLLTRTFSDAKAQQRLSEFCKSAEKELWDTTPEMQWKKIDKHLKTKNIEDFLHGHGQLNTATGNLQNNDGSDPRNNEKYATDQFSFDVARSVRDFYESSASSVRLTDFPLECSAQTVMCCFRRDRQSGDGNGSCNARNCTAQPPADNTNMCFHGDTAFPGDETVHCHGFTWSNDPDHASHKLRSNTLFYVTMYDHWYTRGYVESVLPHAAPMCSCVEDMPAVVRADCTEINMDTEFSVAWSNKKGLQVTPAGPLLYKFQNCKGTPENNDLGSKVAKMAEEGSMDAKTLEMVQRHLVGHGDPENEVNEQACETAYETQRNKVYSSAMSHILANIMMLVFIVVACLL